VLCLVCFPKVVQKQTFGEVETKTYLIVSCVRNISPKYYQNLLIFIQVTIDNVGYVYSGFFVYFNTFCLICFP